MAGSAQGCAYLEILLLREVFRAKLVAELPWRGAALRSPCISVAPSGLVWDQGLYALCGLGFFVINCVLDPHALRKKVSPSTVVEPWRYFLQLEGRPSCLRVGAGDRGLVAGG